MRRHPTADLMMASEVACLFGVSPETVRRWGRGGLLSPVRTPGGRYRYREAEVARLLQGVKGPT